MKKLLLKSVLLCLLSSIAIGLFLPYLSNKVERKGFSNHETESNLFFINDNENFDLLLLGISHARNFSRHKNHQRVEKILDKKFINLGQGGAKAKLNGSF